MNWKEQVEKAALEMFPKAEHQIKEIQREFHRSIFINGATWGKQRAKTALPNLREWLIKERNLAHVNCLEAEKNTYNQVINHIDGMSALPVKEEPTNKPFYDYGQKLGIKINDLQRLMLLAKQHLLPVKEDQEMKYFISYYWNTKEQTGTGCDYVSSTKPIDDYSDIKLIVSYLNNTVKDDYGNAAKCVLINYILLSNQQVKEEGNPDAQ